MSRIALFIVVASAVGGLSACGTPELSQPEYLKVKAFLPSDGSDNVGLHVDPTVYFTDEVDDTSVTEESVYMEYSDRSVLDLECDPDNREPCECEPWEGNRINGDAVATGEMVVFTPRQPLNRNMCYRIKITTAVRGKNQGPLQDLRWPAECLKQVGAFGFYCTVEAE